MKSPQRWLLAALVLVVLGGSVLVINLCSSPAVAADERAAGDHWRNFDGHWSFWHEGDKRWYYTDGVHWYYHNGTGWVLYEFDRLFGKLGFLHGSYKVPADRVKIEVPRHEVFRR
jgi:hypothetical protein